MSVLERIDGLVNQDLLKDLETNLTYIVEELYEEGFESEDIIEYIQNYIGDVLVNTLYKLEKSN